MEPTADHDGSGVVGEPGEDIGDVKPQLRVIPGGLLADADEAGVGVKDAEHSLPREVAEGGGARRRRG